MARLEAFLAAFGVRRDILNLVEMGAGCSTHRILPTSGANSASKQFGVDSVAITSPILQLDNAIVCKTVQKGLLMPIATVPLGSKNFTNIRQHFSEIVNQVARQERRVLVEKHGAPVAAIISPEDLKRLDRLEDEERRRLAAFRAISERFTDVPLDVLEREVAKSIALAGRSNPSRS